jgi:LysR family nitrogen assimilation transcriptional regulator
MPCLDIAVDLKQLRTFLQVAELGSLSKAADRLNIAQPALGRQIKLLEEEFGVSLFRRHGRGMVLTSPGRILLERASSILGLVDDTRAEVSAERDAVSGSVSLGLPPTVGEVLTGRLVARFLKQYPDVTIRIVPAFTGYLIDMLQRGEIDLAITYSTAHVRQIKSEPLVEEALYLVGPADAALRAKRPVPVTALAGLPMILPGPRQGLRMLIEDAAQSAGVKLKLTVEAEALPTLKDLVARGLGYTVLPLMAVQSELRSGVLRAAAIVQPTLKRQLVLSRSIVRPSSNAVRRFSDVLKSEIVDMVKKKAWRGELKVTD